MCRPMEQLSRRISSIVGEPYVSTDGDIIEDASHDATFITSRPQIVARPEDTEQVGAVVAAAYQAGIPITTRGAGTGLSGGAVPLHGGLVIITDRLTTLEVDETSMCARVGAGVITGDLQTAAQAKGLMYPPDPASLARCTIGGNIATNAGGPSCLKYGVTAEYVLGLTVVLAEGKVITTGGRTRKRSAGYRLSQLFVGSEGTLGVVTEAFMRLIPRPPHRGGLLASFETTDSAAASVVALLRSGHLPVACELIDRSSLRFVADLLPPDVDEGSALVLVEQDGHDRAALMDEIRHMGSICATYQGAVTLLPDEADRESLWAARRAIGARLVERRSNRLPEDIAVPLAQIPSMVAAIHRICEQEGVDVSIFGHAGDGNLHPSILFDDQDQQTLARVTRASAQIFREAIALGGTVSAEHGLGALKREFAMEDASESSLELMSQIKKLLDPSGLLNPSKIFPSDPAPEDFLRALPGWGDS